MAFDKYLKQANRDDVGGVPTNTGTVTDNKPPVPSDNFKPTTGAPAPNLAGYQESQAALNKQNVLDMINQNKPGAFTYDPYKQSDAVTQLGASLDKHNQNKPGQFQYDQQAQWDAIMNQILNRDKFSYDLNGDALYQQYKDQYVTQGQQAMMDTMGQAQAMTGGYGNSYAQTVGQQTYQGYLQQINDRVPELYRLALDKYNQDGQDLYNKYGLFQSDYDTKYGQHRDTVADWNAERDYLAGRYDSERNWDYGQYVDGRDFSHGQHRDTMADWQSDRNYAQTDLNNERNWDYRLHRDGIEDQKWQSEFEEDQRQYNQNFNYQMAQPGVEDEEETPVSLYTHTGRTDNYGNRIFIRDGKEFAFAPGVNPYTGGTNPDAKNGTFSNGYQPNNYKGSKLKESGYTINVNGREQNIWTTNGKHYVWDGTDNRYHEVKMKNGNWVVV